MSEISREQEYIGRLYERVDGLRDGASARLALALRQDVGTAQSRLDWRAPAARAFYVATEVAPHGIRRRRHITMRGRRVTGVDDEVLDRGELAGASGLAEDRLAEEVKGRAMMTGVVAAAVRDRQADGPAEFEFGGETLRLAGQVVAEAARRRSRPTWPPCRRSRAAPATSSRTWRRCGASCGRIAECGPGSTACGLCSRRSGCSRSCSPTRSGSPGRRPG